MFKLKKLNARGVAHHAVLMLLVVLSIAGVGAYEVSKSHADSLNTADYTVTVNSEDGCWLAGRTWGSLNLGTLGGSTTKSCLTTCRVASTDYVANGKSPGYCSGQITQNTDADTCVQTRHRIYVQAVGCSRINAQDSTNDSRHCTGYSGNSKYTNAAGNPIPISNYPNYVADYNGGTDKCIAATVATPTLPTPGNPTPTTDSVSSGYCKLLGRVGPDSACQRICSNAGSTLLVNNSVDYCSGYIASLSPANCSATFRNYVTVNGNNVGCARRPNQDSATDTARCQANEGYKYYVGIPGGTDYCTPSAGNIFCTGPIKALNTTAAGKILCPGGNTGSSGGTSGGVDPITGLPLPTIPSNGTITSSAPQSGQGKAVKVEAISQTTCHLLGREWEKATKAKDGTKQAAGCSEESCYKNDKIDVHKKNGSFFCDGYATSAIDQNKCGNLHRKWVDVVQSCASRPNQSDKAGTRVVKAEQCVASYSTYIYRTDQYDECLKPGTVDNLKNVARVSGIPFVKATTLSKAGLCNVLPHKHWNGSRCVQDRPAQTGGGTTGGGQNNGVTTAFCENTLHRHLASPGQCGTCTPGYPYYWNNPDPTAFNKCFTSKAASPDGGKPSGPTKPTPPTCSHNDPTCQPSQGGGSSPTLDGPIECSTFVSRYGKLVHPNAHCKVGDMFDDSEGHDEPTCDAHAFVPVGTVDYIANGVDHYTIDGCQ